jgi:two-component system CheB/CheR fusion protein
VERADRSQHLPHGRLAAVEPHHGTRRDGEPGEPAHVRLEKSILEISEREGLAFALQEFASTASQHFHVVCVCRCNGEVELEANGTATHLYRIAQEAVRNGARHGHAKRIEIALASREGSLALSVRDDGIGLPPEGVRGQGLGLRIMTHRAEIIGATLGISAQPAGGTLVVCRLPHP